MARVSGGLHGPGQVRFRLEPLEPRIFLSAAEVLPESGPPPSSGLESEFELQTQVIGQPSPIQGEIEPNYEPMALIGASVFDGMQTADLVSSSGEANSTGILNLAASNIDLAVVTPAVSATDVKANDTITVSWLIKNLGSDLASGQWIDALFLSADNELDLREQGPWQPGQGEPGQSGDRMLFQRYHFEPLAAGGVYSVSTEPPNASTQIQIGVPNVAAGNYFLLFVVDRSNEPWSDNQLQESDETNNLIALPITVATPAVDLQLSAPSAPADAVAGSKIEVAWAVTNTGVDPAKGAKNPWEESPSWQDAVYLSEDAQFDPRKDMMLSGRRSDSPLGPDASYDAKLTVTMAGNVVGSKYLFIVADVQNAQFETDESNNISPAIPIQLTAPDVDLVMSAPSAPANAVQGSAINLGWTVTNAGKETPQTIWADSVFLSADNVFNPQLDQALVQRWMTTAPLSGGARYLATSTATLPAAASGAKFLFFVAESLNLQAETNETNNISEAVPILIVAPSVDLIVATATVNAAVVRPRVGFTLNYTVNNQGDTSTSSSWVDQIYYSTKPVWDSSAVFLSDYAFGGPALAAKGSYNASRSLFLPADTPPGEGYILILVDKNNSQVETDDTNNAKSLPIQVGKPDLQLLSVSAPASALPGQTVSVSWTVKNASSFRIGMLWDYVYLSTDNVLDAADLYLNNAVRFSALEANASYNASTTFTLPAAQLPGAYYLIVQVDRGNSADDGDLTNNTKAVPFQLGQASDLAITELKAPGRAQLGRSIDVTWTVVNQGEGAAISSWSDYFYISDNATFELGSDRLIGSRSMSGKSPLARGGSYTETIALTVPASALGGKYLLGIADGANNLADANRANNVYALPITITGPDLVPVRAMAPDKANLGQKIELNWTVRNQGDSPSTVAWYDYVYLSDDAVLDTADVVLGYSQGPSDSTLAAAAEYTRTVQVTLPETKVGDRYLLLVTDTSKQQPETDESNNILARPISLAAPDLVVVEVTAPAMATLSENIEVTWNVRNQGAVNAENPWYDAVYISQDAVLDRDDALLRSVWIEPVIPVAAQAGYTMTRAITLPSSGVGDRYLIFMADAFHYQGETDETNNTQAVKITLGAPDLHLVQPSVPSTALSGESITATWTVSNIGDTAAPADWSDAVYLSTDAALDSKDVPLAYVAVMNSTPMAAQSAYTLSTNIPLKNIAPGNYFLILTADAFNSQGELDETNNSKAQPINIAAADLTMTVVQAPPSAALGQSVALTWTVTNQGTVKAPAVWSDRVYLSRDTLWDGADFLLGTFASSVSGGLDPSAAAVASQDILIPSEAATGERYLLFVADAAADLGEVNETNNIASTAITITAPDLIITRLSVPAEVSWGQKAPIEWTVANSGPGPTTRPWADVVYISKDTQLDAADIYLGQAYFDGKSPLALLGSYSLSRDLVIPSGVTGPAYFLLIVDGTYSQPELDESNNVQAAAVNLTAADFAVSDFIVPGSVSLGQTIDVTWTVVNEGTGTPSSGWYDNVYLSANDQWEPADGILLSSWVAPEPALAPGMSYTVTRPVTIPPTAVGTAYLLLKSNALDNKAESNINNNVKAQSMTVSAADLNITGSVPSEVRLGQELALSWTVSNGGAGHTTAHWTDYIYLSDNATYESADRYLASERRLSSEPLTPNASYTMTRKVVLADVVPGRYYLLFAADGSHTQSEADENNNLIAYPLDVMAPNLVVLNPVMPVQTQAGADIEISWTVKNNGNASALAPWTERAVLSTDEWFGNWDDVVLGTVNQMADLGVDGTLPRSAAGKVPWGWQGTYTLFVGVDPARNVVESNEKDNILSANVQVEYGRPPADLVVEMVNVPALSGTGRPLDLSWRVTNQGTAATDGDGWTDLVYLSTDPNGA